MKDHERIDDELTETKAAVQRVLAGLEVGRPQRLDPLTIYPLLHSEARPPAVRLLESAWEDGQADIEPMRLGDRCYLRMACQGPSPALVVVGQIVADWAVLASTLIPANTRAVLSAWQSFGRASRWSQRSFGVAPVALRRRLLRLTPTLASFDTAEVDEGDQIGVCPPLVGKPAAQRDVAKRPSGSKSNAPSGLLVAWGQRILGVDLFGSPELYAPIRDRLVTSYLGESPALAGKGECTLQQVREFLARVGASMQPRRRKLGPGEEMEIEGTDLLGSVVACRQAVCHLVALTTGH